MSVMSKLREKMSKLRNTDAYRAKAAARGLRVDVEGREILDEKPHSLHVPDYEPLEETVRRFTSADMQRFLQEQGFETLDDQDALDDEDAELHPSHEFGFEEFKDLTDREIAAQSEKIAAQRAEYDAFQAYLKEKAEKTASGEVSTLSATPPLPKSRPQATRPPDEAGEPVGDDFGG